MSTGPLAGIRIVELSAIGPVPHAGMLLSDLGADVIRIDRSGGIALTQSERPDWLSRGRRSIVLDLTDAAERETALELIAAADVLIEGNRPGVAERLGIGPEVCLERNPRLIYARMTGWGQTGPLADRAGHDINYLALTGGLHAMGAPDEPPMPPLNLVADGAGGAMMLAMGVLAALVDRDRTGRGDIIDVAMVDGTAAALQIIWGLRGQGRWSDERGVNMLDGSAPFYRCYECADGRYVAVGCLEPQFYAAMLEGLGLEASAIPDRNDPHEWAALTELLSTTFATRKRDEWAEIFGETDACVAPVLTFAEAECNQHLAARQSVQRYGDVLQASPAPRFERHVLGTPAPPPTPDADRAAILADWLGES